MTLKELSQLYYLRMEIEMDEQRLAELEAKASPGAQMVSDMPHGYGAGAKVGRLAVAIADLRETIASKKQRCILERTRLEGYIASIEDSLLRQIFTCRFVEGLSWKEVASRVGGGNSAASVRMSCKRFLGKK